MVVHDFHLIRISILPQEADTPLIVDPDAVLTLSIAAQRLQAIPGRNRQVTKLGCGMDLRQLPLSDAHETLKTPHVFTVVQFLCVGTPERFDHVGRL